MGRPWNKRRDREEKIILKWLGLGVQWAVAGITYLLSQWTVFICSFQDIPQAIIRL